MADRIQATQRLLDSLESDWDLNRKERLLAMLWALFENLVELGLPGQANRIHSLVLSSKILNLSTGERLRFHFFPEIRYRLQELEAKKAKATPLDHLHPRIQEVSVERFRAGHFADAVEAAFKEVNSTVKFIVREQLDQEFDGAKLMERALSADSPIIKLTDMSTESGRSEQVGYLKIFSGAMTGIRNPKAHANLDIDPVEAAHLLSLASLLMMKVDRRVKPNMSGPENPPAQPED